MIRKMKLEELGELYRLLVCYKKIYNIRDLNELSATIEDIKQQYETEASRINGPSGYQIVPAKVTNIRGAGRNPIYTDQERDHILELRETGKTIRKIAEEVHCSIGFVHKIIKEQKYLD